MNIQDILDDIYNKSSENDYGRRCWHVPGSIIGVALTEILQHYEKVSVEKSDTKPGDFVITVLREY